MTRNKILILILCLKWVATVATKYLNNLLSVLIKFLFEVKEHIYWACFVELKYCLVLMKNLNYFVEKEI